MDTLHLVLDIIESLGIVAALIVSVYTLTQNNKLFLKKSKSTILTAKRSERIDLLRQYSSTILSEGELCLLGEKVDARLLVTAVNNYSSVLQYNLNYEDDVKLIKMVHEIKRMILSKSTSKSELKEALNNFYFYNDMYVAVEFSRVASEIKNANNEYKSVESQKEDALEKKQLFVDNYNAIKEKKETIY